MASLRAPVSSARPTPVMIAVALSAILIVVNFAAFALPTGNAGDKATILVVGTILGAVGIAAAVGLWLLRKWGFILTIVVTAINLLLSLPEVPGAATTFLKVLAAAIILASIAIIVLVTRPEARRAYR